MSERLIGKVTHYFKKVGVATLELTEPLSKGNRIHIRGHTTDLTQTVESIEIEHKQIETASPGDTVGIKVADRVREGDNVYLASEEAEEAESQSG